MPKLRIWLTTHIVAGAIIGIAACSTSAPENRDKPGLSGKTSSAVRTVDALSGSPGCPEGTMVLCGVSHIDCTYGPIACDGPPRMSDQCAPLIEVALNSNGSSFVWSSPAGQRIDAVVAKGGDGANVYLYDPAISSDATPLSAPEQPTLNYIRFCTKPDGGGGGGETEEKDATADAEGTPAPPTDAGSSKTW